MLNKGQTISKCLFGVFNFLQKNEQKQVNLRFHSSKVKFVCSFFGGNVYLNKSFRLFLTFSKHSPRNDFYSFVGTPHHKTQSVALSCLYAYVHWTKIVQNGSGDQKYSWQWTLANTEWLLLYTVQILFYFCSSRMQFTNWNIVKKKKYKALPNQIGALQT